MTTQKVEKVFVNTENNATFMCPECGTSKVVNVAQYMKVESSVRVKCKCKCGHTYPVIIERRKFFRKQTNLLGLLFYDNDYKRGLMTVEDVSRSGIKIRINSPIDLKLGDKMEVEFNLDDRDRSLIRREVVVRSIRGQNIGLEFLSMDHYDKLGTYLMFG
ncbi:MAG: PilZ domain-containing protein [Desulfobacterales bacterium]|nr:PilZ domain-containing protein [Desulfobacterales bacterium]